MKKTNTIKVKNELPELLEAVCAHEDCPEWLKLGIWDLVNEQNIEVIYTANYWRSQFEGMYDYEPEVLPNVIREGAAQ